MILIFYPDKDCSLYELYPELNSGIDEVLDISHIDDNGSLSISRALIDFSSSISEISKSISNGLLSDTYSIDMKMYTYLSEELPIKYNIEVFPLYESWEMGSGKRNHSPIIKNGASWKYRDGSKLATTWSIDNYPTGVTGSYTTETGGGNWYYDYKLTKSFNNESSDIKLDITTIFDAWIENSISQSGLILKRTYEDEISDEYQGNTKYFSNESNTIYSPIIRYKYDDSVFSTGSLTPIPESKDIIVYPKNKRVYREGEIARIDVNVRLKYPDRTFSTQSSYITNYYLPSSSYYEISDYITDDKIIEFDDNYTKISCDSNGNYFNIRTDNFMLNRFYKISVKTIRDGNQELYYDDKFIFKVIK